MKQKTCIRCLSSINESKERYVMFIVKEKNRILEFRCFHVSCWKKHFEDVLEEYIQGGSERVW